jgi:hypothetical protein
MPVNIAKKHLTSQESKSDGQLGEQSISPGKRAKQMVSQDAK